MDSQERNLHQGNILVVDDTPANLKLLTAMLKEQGYKVRPVPSGPLALKAAKSEPPDVVLLDVMMPDMDGFEVARRLRNEEETRNVPIVMVTALNDLESRVKALEAGADDFLTKPVEEPEVKARVKTLIKVKRYNDYMVNYQKELEIEVEKKTRELKNAFELIKGASLETIFRLSKAAEYKDEETGNHTKRVSSYSEVIARNMGLPDNLVEAIKYASPMHDIGKIGIPDHILLKPGKLDDEEWVIMREHTVIGEKILEGSDFQYIKIARNIALTHHEKWNGTGYPRGIKGTDIAIEGRITAVGDVFDALISKRPYKPPFTYEKAFEIIKEGRSSHFDPEAVDSLIAKSGEIIKIAQELIQH